MFRPLVVSVWGLEIISLTDPFSLLMDLYHSRVTLRSLEMLAMVFFCCHSLLCDFVVTAVVLLMECTT